MGGSQKKGERIVMKRITEFLQKNGIDHKAVTLGNPYYYNDGFTVQGIRILFDYELAEDASELYQKQCAFLKYMKRRKKQCIGYSGKCGIHIPWYTVLDASDFERLEEHENRIQADVERFWEEEHSRRVCRA